MSEIFLGKPAKIVEDFIIGGNVIDYEDKGVVFEPYELVKSKGEVLNQNFCISGDFSKIKRILKISNNFKSIENNTFKQNQTLKYANLDGILSISHTAFYQCSNLSSINIPNVSSININTFCQCSNLSSINIPNVSLIGNGAFSYCSKLSSINCSNVTSIGQYTFYKCSTLTSINSSSVTSIGIYAFSYCSKLSSIDFSDRTLTSIPTLDNINAFSGLPSNYQITVPNDLYNDWINATNWTLISSHIITV